MESPQASITEEQKFLIPSGSLPQPCLVGCGCEGRSCRNGGTLAGRVGLPSKSSQPIKHLMFSAPQERCTSVLPMYLSSFIFTIL